MKTEEIELFMQKADKELSSSLCEFIVNYLVQDGNYCEELSICLHGKKNETDEPVSQPVGKNKRFSELTLPERQNWIVFNYRNASRGYIIKTFTYYWIYKMFLKKADSFIDEGRRQTFDAFFGKR